MNIIDFRLRAPISAYTTMFKTNPASIQCYGINSARYLYDMSFDTMLDEMNESNVVKAVVPGRSYGWTGQPVDNDEAIKAICKYDDILYFMPGFDVDKGHETLDSIDRYCKQGTCKGITIEPGYGRNPLKVTDKTIYPIYEKCENDGLVIFLSFGGLTAPSCSFNDPQLVDQVARDFPDLKLVLGHGGYPYVTEICFVAFQRENVFLVPDFYFVNVPGSEDYHRAVNFIPEKILFGSGAPLAGIKSMTEFYLNCGALEENIEKVMYKNAAKLLGID